MRQGTLAGAGPLPPRRPPPPLPPKPAIPTPCRLPVPPRWILPSPLPRKPLCMGKRRWGPWWWRTARCWRAERNRMRELNDPTAHAEMLAIRGGVGETRQRPARWLRPLCDARALRHVRRRHRPCPAAAALLWGGGSEGRGGRQWREAVRTAELPSRAGGHFRGGRSPCGGVVDSVLSGSAINASTLRLSCRLKLSLSLAACSTISRTRQNSSVPKLSTCGRT